MDKMTQHQAMQIATIARQVGARVRDPHDVHLGTVVAQISFPPHVITGTICSSDEYAPNIMTTKASFDPEDLEMIERLVADLLQFFDSFVTRTRDGSVKWTIGLPVDESDPSES